MLRSAVPSDKTRRLLGSLTFSFPYSSETDEFSMQRRVQRKTYVLCGFKDINYTISTGSYHVLAQKLLILRSDSYFATYFCAWFVTPYAWIVQII